MLPYTANKAVETYKVVQANGSIIYVSPNIFLDILQKTNEPILIYSYSTQMFNKKHMYLTEYRNMHFYTDSKEPIDIPESIKPELFIADHMWVPNFK
jgi:hypothetical protein